MYVPRHLVICSNVSGNGTELYTPTVGIFNRCTRLYGRSHCANFNVDGLATDSNVFPECWKASLFFLSSGLAVMSITVIAALLGCCVQSIGRKSIFNLAGVAQAVAGKVVSHEGRSIWKHARSLMMWFWWSSLKNAMLSWKWPRYVLWLVKRESYWPSLDWRILHINYDHDKLWQNLKRNMYVVFLFPQVYYISSGWSCILQVGVPRGYRGFAVLKPTPSISLIAVLVFR